MGSKVRCFELGCGTGSIPSRKDFRPVHGIGASPASLGIWVLNKQWLAIGYDDHMPSLKGQDDLSLVYRQVEVRSSVG